MMFSDDYVVPDEMAKVTVTAFIEEELKDDLKALADAERRSMSQMVALLIERAIQKARDDGTISADVKK
ncbi:MAG: hypothetical protein AAGF98_10100 [Cyanobacteria bacterium P01_H01_bin.153]|jgi:hypothetical protein